MVRRLHHTYVGELRDRLRHGRGTYTFPMHGLFQYAGEWQRGDMHGQGVFSIGQQQQDALGGSVYEGEFQNGEIEGVGLQRWANGDSYSGQFHCGERHGEGVYLAHSGERYSGQWRANQRVGTGELTFANGDDYTGSFADHRPHGRGRIVFAATDQSLDGEWQRGAITGNGVLCDRNGAMLYDGEWRDAQRDGCGTGVLLPDGIDSLGSSANGCEPVWYSGTWRANCPAERTTRLEVKLVALPSLHTGTDSRPASAASGAPVDSVEPGVSSNDADAQLLELPSTLVVENRTLPQLVVLSVADASSAASGPLDSSSGSSSAVVRGESRRCIRLRVFEGLYDATQGSAPADPSDEQQRQQLDTEQMGDASPSAQWQFVRLATEVAAVEALTVTTEVAAAEPEMRADGQELQLLNDTSSGGNANATATFPAAESSVDDDSAVADEPPEHRVDEVVIENAGGRAIVAGLALPAATLPGSYYILCESLAPSDTLAPVAINLLVM